MRDRPQGMKYITRTRVKGVTTLPEIVPDFYAASPIPTVGEVTVQASPLKTSSTEKSVFSACAPFTKTADQDFEQLDPELEDLFKKPRRVSVPSPSSTINQYHPPEEFPNFPHLNCNVGGLDYSLKKRTSYSYEASTKAKSQEVMESSFPPTNHTGPSFNFDPPPPVAVANIYNQRDPSPLSSSGGSEPAACDFEALDEFSKFIDAMIQLPM